MRRMFRFAGLIAVFFAAVSFAETAVAQVISEIRVEGNQRIEPETVRSYMVIAPGDQFDPERIDRSLKTLFATSLFADVTVRREGSALVVRVVENPIINRLAFEGNQRIGDETLAAEVQLRPRVVYTRTKVQSDVARISEIYRRSGRFGATVEPKVIQLEQNRVDLVFEIDEGPLTRIQKISFIGNKQFSDSRLREAIQTQESVWYRFLTSSDTYDPDRLTFDRELLRRFYLSHGYADFRVVSAVAELVRDRTAFFITFAIEEGDRYKFGGVEVETTLRDLDAGQLFEFVETEPGDWYNADLVEDTVQELTTQVGNLGFAFVDIEPSVKRNREERTIDLIYIVEEGARVFVERINISGNIRTLDKVIRREFRLVEGDAFSSAKLRRSQQRIRALGFFESVEVSSSQGSTPDKAVIDVEVSETSTGELSFGGGFSSFEGPIANVAIRERNLLGRGQDLRLAFTVSGRRQQLDLSFTEPYFLDRDLSAGFDIFKRVTDVTDEDTYDQSSLGFSLRMSYPLSERLRHSIRYTLRSDEIENVAFNASEFIKRQEGSSTTSAVGHTLTYDNRDDRFFPTEGYLLRVTQDLAGLGGDVQYLRHSGEARYYFPITEQWIGNLSGSIGHIFGLDDDVRIQDRFFVGGATFRGFEAAGVGPRDSITTDSLGGNSFAIGTAEVSFPLGLPSEFNIRGRFFSDFGTITGIDDQEPPKILDEASLRATVGFGLTYVSPFGPIEVDLATSVLDEDFDKTELFRFSFGTRF